MGVIWPMVKGAAVALPGAHKRVLEDMLDEAMPEGHCHVVVIGMDDDGLVGVVPSPMDVGTMLWMIKQAESIVMEGD